MQLSIVISAYSLKRIADLIDLLDALSKQTLEPNEILIIIDESVELSKKIEEYINKNKYKCMRVIFNPTNKGLSFSRNIGLKNSLGDIIAFIDDDAIPYNYWAKSIVETFTEDQNVGAVTGDIIPLWEHEGMSWFPKELHWMISCSYIMTPCNKQEVERGFGTNMAFRREVFEKVGIFNTNFGINGKKWIGGEDTDMFLRVKKTGMKVMFNPDMRIQHKIYSNRIILNNLLKRAYNGGYSVSLMKKHIDYSLDSSLEKNYVKCLLNNFYYFKIKQMVISPSWIHIKQLSVVTLVLISEFLGYLYSTVKNEKLC
jgi:GT2 family glycosyltransferase